MRLNGVERVVMNTRARAAHQQLREAAWFRRLGGRLDGALVLEAGCGRGVGVEVLLDQLGAAHVTAVDSDAAMVARARRRLTARAERTSVMHGDMCSLDFPDAAFDAAVTFGAVHHVPDWRRAVAELARVLRPGGRYYFLEVPRRVLGTWLFRTFTDHPRSDRFEPAEFVAELASRGLRLVAGPHSRAAGLVFVGVAMKSP